MQERKISTKTSQKNCRCMKSAETRLTQPSRSGQHCHLPFCLEEVLFSCIDEFQELVLNPLKTDVLLLIYFKHTGQLY